MNRSVNRSLKRPTTWVAGVVVVAAVALAATTYPGRTARTGGEMAQQALATAPSGSPGWTVGRLRPDGLRIISSGRSDASAVLDPAQFADAKVRHAYEVARSIPAVLNQLYCWCGCENSGAHRSNLACFEDRMAVDCDVCQGTAETADRMVRQGVTRAGTIQAAVDARWAPRG